jgi:hypothetical protein
LYALFSDLPLTYSSANINPSCARKLRTVTVHVNYNLIEILHLETLATMVFGGDGEFKSFASLSRAASTTSKLFPKIAAPRPALTTFHKFLHLPGELQLEIYKLTCHHPRVVDVRPSRYPRMAILMYDSFRFQSNTAPPALLSVCHMARKEALKHYTLPLQHRPSDQKIYINFASDTVAPITTIDGGNYVLLHRPLTC